MMNANMLAKFTSIAAAWLLLAAMVPTAAAKELPRQPTLGFDGELVDVPGDSFPDELGVKGMKVLSVRRGSPADRMGLERGDIVVNIDTWSFKSQAGYRAALRQAESQKPSIFLINVRNGEMTRDSCNLPHQVDQQQHPDTVQLAIDLEEDMFGTR